MKATDLYRLMESPALLTEDTLQQLKQIVDEFPYFQIARMLYLKNLAVLNDIRFGAELKKMAIYVPDRRKLFTLIEGERFGLQLQSAKEENPTREDAFSLIDAFLSNREEEEPKTDASLLFQPSVSSDYIYWSLTKENGQVEEKEEEEEVRLQHHDLIDSFIKNEEQRTPGSGLNLDMETTGAPVPGNLAELEENQHKPLDDSYFTETLAHIYVKQKRYEKALQIIKNLNLKYPEKNVYFADQIRFLEKLIINTKNKTKMYVFISILILIASILLILIVLIQNSKGGGLASGFSSSNQIMGVRKTTDFLEKATWTLAGTVVVLSIVITAFIPRAQHANQSEIKEQINNAVTIDPNTVAPDFGTAQQPATAPVSSSEEEAPAN